MILLVSRGYQTIDLFTIYAIKLYINLHNHFRMQQEGQLTSVQVHGYQKRYDPEKYYMYILRIQRKGQPDPTYLFRSYKEFCEFYQKLCIHFPLAKVAR